MQRGFIVFMFPIGLRCFRKRVFLRSQEPLPPKCISCNRYNPYTSAAVRGCCHLTRTRVPNALFYQAFCFPFFALVS